MTKTVFLQKNSHFNLHDKVNIVLSPELYWVRIFDIPIDSMSEVKRVVPDFFEEFFDIKNYKFKVIKIDKHKYLCFAYDENDIVQKIKDSSLEFKNIINIYFAQNELISRFKNELFYNINNKTYALKDGIIIKIPDALATNVQKKDFFFDNITFSNHKVYINQSSKYIDIKTAYILSTIFILFSLITFSKSIYINNRASSYENKIEKLKKQYSLPLSKIQTKSIMNEFKASKNNYFKVLKSMQYILKYKDQINTKLISINYSNLNLMIKFENKNENNIKKYIQKKYKIISSNKSKDILSIRVKI